MMKLKAAKPERKSKVVVQVKSTDLMKCIKSSTDLAAIERPEFNKMDMSRISELLTAILYGSKIKVVKAFDLELELSKFENLPLECDGLSRVLSYKLREFRIKHMLMIGHFTVDGQKAVPIHWWIELADGTTVDYRARMWGGSHPHIPHGVFLQKNFERVVYVGVEQNIQVPEKIFKILTMELADKKATA